MLTAAPSAQQAPLALVKLSSRERELVTLVAWHAWSKSNTQRRTTRSARPCPMNATVLTAAYNGGSACVIPVGVRHLAPYRQSAPSKG